MTTDTAQLGPDEPNLLPDSPLLMSNGKKPLMIAGGAALVMVTFIATAMMWPKDQALAVEFTLGAGEGPAQYVGTIASLAIAERCGLPVKLGTGMTTVSQAREHLRIDPAFTDKVPILVVAKPDSQFRIVGNDITCPVD
jgi:hypothetical protein